MWSGTAWRQQFLSGDLGRGDDFYYMGQLRGLAHQSDGWRAKAFGTMVYDTFVPDDPADPHGMSCTCPRFANGYLCKHLAATCMAIEDEELIGACRAGGAGKTDAANEDPPDLEQLVAAASDEGVRSFLLQALRHDELLATEFVQRFGKVDARVARERLALQIEKVAWECSDRGFIDWNSSLVFERRYHEVVYASIDPLVERGEYAAALELSVQVLRSLERIAIDDSNGFFSGAIDDVKRMWETWIASGGEAFERQLFSAIGTYLDDEPDDDETYDIYLYAANMAREVLFAHYADLPEYAADFVAMADERIEDARTYGGNPARWVIVRLRALRASGMGAEELLKEAGPFAEEESVCQFLVDWALERGDAELAVALLEGCKEASRKRADGTYSLAVSRQLAILYEGRDVGAMRGELRYLLQHVTCYGAADRPEDLWARLRESYDADEWAVRRDALLAELPDVVHLDCLAAEGLYDRLMLEAEKGGASAVRAYESELVPHYPDRVLKVYLDELVAHGANPGSSRKAYRYLAQELRHVKSLPGGEAPVRRFVAQMRQRFPRRPALLDELSRV